MDATWPGSLDRWGCVVRIRAPLAVTPGECQALSRRPSNRPAVHRDYTGAHRRRNDMTTKIRPLQDRIIVKRVEEEEKTKGGIIIPDTAKEKPIEGKVIAVGNGKVQEDGKVRPLDVKAGDRILFSKYAGTEVKIDGEEHLIMREEDILGVIEG
jgi:chaperonin GroES